MGEDEDSYDDPFSPVSPAWDEELDEEDIPVLEEEKRSPDELTALRFHCLGCGDCLCDAYCREYERITAKIRRDRRSLQR